jgi:hypothetical protein
MHTASTLMCGLTLLACRTIDHFEPITSLGRQRRERGAGRPRKTRLRDTS